MSIPNFSDTLFIEFFLPKRELEHIQFQQWMQNSSIKNEKNY